MRRRIQILILVVVGLLAVTLVGLWAVKPWVPPIEIVDPGPTGRRIDEAGVFANYYPAEEAPKGAILLIGGSLGGITEYVDRAARSLQQHGYSVLAASYFGSPGQPRTLERIPLETFDRAVEWLISQPEAPAGRLAVMGTSKGAEAAPLIALRHPGIQAVVAAAPSSAVWPGIDWYSLDALNADSSWTSGGEPLPHLPYASLHPAILVGDLGRLYRDAVERVADHPAAAIPIEDLEAPVLLICGEMDRLWPACPMSRQLRARAEAAGGPPVTVLAYERVGHASLEPPYTHPDVGPDPRWGGSAEDANAAMADSWGIVLDFLDEHVAGDTSPGSTP